MAVRKGRTEQKRANWRTKGTRGPHWICCCVAAVSGVVALLPLILMQTGFFHASTRVPAAPFSKSPVQTAMTKAFQTQANSHEPLHGFGLRPHKENNGTGTSLIQKAAKTIGPEEHFVVATKVGNITIKFRADKAPKHVEYMKELIGRKAYNGMCWYRAEKNFVLQGGLRNADGRVFPSNLPSPKLEYNLPNRRGFVNMARWEDPDSAGGDFCILLGDSPHLDKHGTSGYAAGFTVWAEVVDGMHVADQISLGATKSLGGLNFLKNAITFESVTLV